MLVNRAYPIMYIMAVAHWALALLCFWTNRKHQNMVDKFHGDLHENNKIVLLPPPGLRTEDVIEDTRNALLFISVSECLFLHKYLILISARKPIQMRRSSSATS
jgi:hypothetical protein